MEKSNFSRLLERYLTGEISEEERIKLEAWLDIVKTGARADARLSKEEEEKLFQKIISKRADIREIGSSLPTRRKVGVSGWTFRVAAGLLIVAAVAYTGWKIGVEGNGSLHVASDADVKKVILADGSLVWLKANSELTYYINRDEGIRYTELKGEALFEVAKDPAHPFVIRCGEAMLKVLGTSFNVKVRHDSLELKVLTGVVNVSLASDNRGVNVEPNEKVVHVGSGNMEKLSLAASEIALTTANTEYAMNFVNISLDHVLAELERKFSVSINIADKQAGTCTLTVDLTDRSLETSLEMITEVLDVEYKRDREVITLTGNGCR